MDPITEDVQGNALFGTVPNPSYMDAMSLNPTASGPDDWTTVLTKGVAGVAVSGLNGLVNNAVNAGAINNAVAAQPLAAAANQRLITLAVIAAIVYMVVK